MLKILPYRSTIKSRSLFFVETRKLTDLILKGLNDAELKKIIIDENLFQVHSETRRKEIARTIKLRLQSLDLFLQRHIVTDNIETSKSIILYSIMKTDRLFTEFMHEVIYEKSVIRQNQFKNIDIDRFFESKKQQSKTVNSWADSTIYKLKQVYKTILTDAGFIQRRNNYYEITLPIINPLIANHIQKKETLSFIHYLFGRN